MNNRVVSVLLSAIVISCGENVSGPVGMSAHDIAGEYELTQVYGKPLPAESSARTTVYSGHLSMQENLLFTRSGKAETCLPIGGCAVDSATTTGVWVILQDGRLYFNDGRGASWPVPRVEATGSEIRFYTDGIGEPRELFRKQGH